MSQQQILQPIHTQTANTAAAADPYAGESLASLSAKVANNFNDCYSSFTGKYISFPTRFPNFRVAMANMRLGTSDPLVLFMGDSTLGGLTNGAVYNKLNGVPHFVGSRLTSYGIPASEETLSLQSNSTGFSWDSRISPGTWANNNTQIAGPMGGMARSGTASDTMTFTPARQIDSFDVYTYDFTSGATVTCNVNGGATLATITGTGSGVVVKTTVACTLGANVINLVKGGSGNSFILNVIPHTSTARQINIANACWPSGVAGSWYNTTQAWASGSQQPWTVMAPKLVIFELTINDSQLSTPLSTYLANIQGLITLAQTSGADVILSTGHPTSNAAATVNLPPMLAGLYNLASANNCGLIDINQYRYVSYAAFNAITPYLDLTHFQAPGSMDKAEAYAQAIIAAMSN
jgi:hypothetical protein